MLLDEIFEVVDFGEEIKCRIESIKEKPKRITEMVEIQFLEYNKEERTVTYEFPIFEWEANPNDVLHGGIGATMVDFALGLFANVVCMKLGGYFAPTTNMNINYLLPIPMTETVVITAKLVSSGGSLLSLNGEVKSKGSNELAITASATYKVMKV